MIAGQTADELAFSNGSVIRAYPCSARGIRGDAWSCAILDEAGHYVTTEEGNAAGDRILEAALPALAQFGPEGWLVAVSTPLWKAGMFWKLTERAQSGRFPLMHYVHKTTAQMNPHIPTAWLEEQRRADPDLYAREFEARFIDGASSYLESTDVVACVRHGVGILPPQPRLAYKGALDPAYALDAFSMAVAHRDSDGVFVVDGVWVWKRAGHDATLDAVADIANQYGVKSLRTDQHSPVPIREGLARRHLACEYAPWTNESKSDAFAALKIALNTRAIQLPDDPALVEELCALEARPTPAGFTRIAATPGRHDDRAFAVAAVLASLKASRSISEATFNESVAPGIMGGYPGIGRGIPDVPLHGPGSGGFSDAFGKVF